jgi:benzoyl-CoA reductase/2-hydroxyglutaryl-CoA dehydratase subunit BcrC/BadD/HgdB
MEHAQPPSPTSHAGNIAEAFAILAKLYANRFDVPRNSPRKTVGYLSRNVPCELIRAAGCEAVQLHGSRDDITAQGSCYMEACFDADIRAVFERFLRADFDHLDLVIIPRSSEALLQLYYYLTEVQRCEPTRRFPPLYLFDVLYTPYRSTGKYVKDQVLRLAARLQCLTGKELDPSAIQHEIRTAERHRLLLEEINALRHEVPARLSGTQALQIFGSASGPQAEHCAALELLLANRSSMPSLDGPRLMIKGSAQHALDFYRMVESTGALIVADDHLTGDLAIGGALDESPDPLATIAHKAHRRSPSIRNFPQARCDEQFHTRLRKAQIDAVIFSYEDTDDTYGWEYPDQKAWLDLNGIPSLLLLKQSFRDPVTWDVAANVDQFVRTLQSSRAQLNSAL